ncbi:MAG: histidinol-phosphate transaminase [Methanoregula sp.]|jgi:threonine-phosphate decarboxylase|uniref:pyridoxal phosphate-dependent aminotransferase n=1 Tax=Methanoregula sp. TaxID=2052170 RepID=UPI003D0EE61C
MAVDFPRSVVHGGTGKRQRENTGKNPLDFSASLNPLPPRFTWHCDPACLSSYPDNEYVQLKECIAHTFHREPEEICVGNGSIELIRVFCSVMLSGKKTYFAESPTFGEYALSARLAGASAARTSEAANVSFVCNPNNPTGELCRHSDLMARIKAISSHEGMLFADEAFIELADPSESLVDVRAVPLFVLRSLTKSFAVPGIRFGYGFGDPDLIAKIETVRPPWSVNAYAEAFALQAFSHLDELGKSRDYIRKERDWLSLRIEELRLRCPPSSANYLLVDCACNVGPLCTQLETHNILVRDCTSFGLASCIRVAIRTHEENEQLVEALSACVR